MLGRANGEDVAIFGNNIPITTKNRRPFLFEQFGSAFAEALHPANLVVEFLGADRIAVGQVKRADDHVLRLGFDVPAMAIVGIAGEADPTKLGRVAFCQDGDPVEAFLTVPDGAVTRGLYVSDGERLVGALEFLQRNDVRLLALEPFDEPRQPRTDTVEVIGRNLHLGALSRARSDREARVTALSHAIHAGSIFLELRIAGMDHADRLVFLGRGREQHDRQ